MRKQVKTLIQAQSRPHWVGDGFLVHPLFNEMAFQKELSPFLMFDYGAPKDFPRTSSKLGVGMHAHRGFETVTIALQGEIEHKDNKGNGGVIGAGDVQWMTAGQGIFHEEFHSRAFARTGGTLEMMQLWVNLPARLKLVPPRYQAITASQIPTVPLLDGDNSNIGHVRVIAGVFESTPGAATTEFYDAKGDSLGAPRGCVQLWEVILEPGQSHIFSLAEGHTCLLFARQGTCVINADSEAPTSLTTPRIALMTRQGATFRLTSGDARVSVFVLGGQPYLDAQGRDEPIASYGPMVMNTQAEINAAMEWARKEQRYL